jgi:hypothetical protein
VFDNLPEDLPRLETLRVWHTLWLTRISAKIAACGSGRKKLSEADADAPRLLRGR